MRLRHHGWLILPGAAALIFAVLLYARWDRSASEQPVPAVVIHTHPVKLKPGRETFAQVVKGMTLDQATALIGAPPGVYIRGELGSDVVLIPRGLGWSGYVQWVTDDAELLVLFTDEANRPILPEEVRSDDRIVEVHLWDVMNFKR